MWALIVFLVLWLLFSAISVVGLAIAPSTVRATAADKWTAVGFSGGVAGALTLLLIGVVALFRGLI